MKLTLDIPDELMHDAKRMTLIEEEQTIVLTAIQKMIDSYNVSEIKEYFGKLNLDIDMDNLRDR